MLFVKETSYEWVSYSSINKKPKHLRKSYIYIVIHRQICFVLSELISVARQYLPVAGIETWLTQTPSQSF